MNIWRDTLELIWTGFKSLFREPNGIGNCTISGVLTYVGVPLIVSICSILFNVLIKESLISDILTVLSIFLAITLGVIFIVPDKLSKRLDSDTSENQSDINSRIRYKNFCRLFIQRLSFILVMSVVLIILTIIMQIISDFCMVILSGIILGLFALSILSILKLVIDIYVFLMADINRMR